MKKYRITVNGTSYEVEVEELGASYAPAPAAPAPAARPAAPKAAPAPVAAPAPAAPAAAPSAVGSASAHRACFHTGIPAGAKRGRNACGAG